MGIMKKVGLAFILAAAIGAPSFHRLARHYEHQLEKTKAEVVSFDESMKQKIKKAEGSLYDYERYQELKERYIGFERAYWADEKRRETERKIIDYKHNLQAAGICFLMCLAVPPAVGFAAVREYIQRKRSRPS